MKGWKMMTAGILAMLYGAVGWISGLHGGDAAATFMVNGLGLLGAGHKFDKLIGAVGGLLGGQEQPPPPVYEGPAELPAQNINLHVTFESAPKPPSFWQRLFGRA